MRHYIKKWMLPRNVSAIALLLAALHAAAEPQSTAGQPVQESAATRLAAMNEQGDKDQFAVRLESVKHLLETSSAAHQVEVSNNPQAAALREQARGVYSAARDACNAGDLHKAGLLLNEATRTMFKAVSLAAPASVTAKKVENDFKLRQESIRVLLAAYKRVAAEKSVAKDVAETEARVEKLMSAAASLADAGRFADGRAELDRAYATITAGVRGLRNGDTVVRSLNFASKEEEYHYELDRNDTHQMLITVLVNEKRATSPELDRDVSAFVAKAKELRVAAEASAAARDYAAAIKLMDESTNELVKAIRNAGVYIPG